MNQPFHLQGVMLAGVLFFPALAIGAQTAAGAHERLLPAAGRRGGVAAGA